MSASPSPLQTIDKLSAGSAQIGDALMPPPWRPALLRLLTALGLTEDMSQCATLDDVAGALALTGFEFEPMGDNHMLATVRQDVLGALVRTHDDDWIAIAGAVHDGDELFPEGARRSPRYTKEAVAETWVVSKRRIGLGALSPFMQRHKGQLVDLFLAAILVNGFALTLPFFSSFVYDKILGNGILATLWALVIGMGLVIGVEFCVRMIRIMVAERFAISSDVDIDHGVFRNLLDAPSLSLPSLGGLLEKYKQIISSRDFLSSSYLLALADLPFLVLFLLTIMYFAGPLALVALLCGGLMLAASLFMIPPVLHYEHMARRASERRFGLIADFLSSHEAVIGSAMRNRFENDWRGASATAAQASSKSRFWRGFNMTIISSLSYASYVAVLAGGVYMVEAHRLTSGGLLAVTMLTSRVMGSFASVVTLLTRYREFRIALAELSRLIPDTSRVGSARPRGRLRGALRLDRVTCRLGKDDRPVLEGVHLSIGAGEIVGLAGAPGAGKTTLLRLIAGVLSPDEGMILIDNLPLDRLSLDDVTLNIGLKPQDFCLLDGTIEDNVRAGRAPLTQDEREAVLRLSGLGRLFDEGALNWTTEIGVRGANLSGGQRQLVALARALHTRPTLILLDEPTNGLDAVLEAHLAQQIRALGGRSTVIVSSHSRTLLSICDRIVVLGQSRILADGPRERVLA